MSTRGEPAVRGTAWLGAGLHGRVPARLGQARPGDSKESLSEKMGGGILKN